MTAVSEPPHAGPLTEAPPAPLSPERKRQIGIEIGAVVALTVLPFLLWAVGSLVLPDFKPAETLGGQAAAHVVSSIQVTLPLLYIMWRSGEVWAFFGWRPVRWWRDPLIALLLYALSYVAMTAAAYGITAEEMMGFRALAGGADGIIMPRGAMDWGFVVLIALVNGFSEEVAIRGYLLPRIEQYLNSSLGAILITSAMFAAYHIYYGPGELLPFFAMGVVMGCAFCAMRRVWPLIFCHIIADIVPFAI